jgi:uncharacterized protein
MDFSILLILAAVGCLMGFTAGFFGVGGGIVLVPLLLIVYAHIGVEPAISSHIAFGTSLFVSTFTSLSSSYRHYKNRNVIIQAVIILALTSIVTALIGSWIADQLTSLSLRRIFSFVIFLAGLRLAMQKNEKQNDRVAKLSKPGLIGIGIFTGFVSSLAGVGGGVFSIPMMYQFLRFPIKKAIGTSSAVIVFTTLFASAGYMINGWGRPDLPSYALGYVHFGAAIPVMLTAILFSQFGAMATHKMEVNTLRRIFGGFLVAVGVYIFLSS